MLNNSKPIFICKNCHEEDKRVVGCGCTFDQHDNIPFVLRCSTCGKQGLVCFCFEYSHFVRNNCVDRNKRIQRND